jgi:hypothetical protein
MITPLTTLQLFCMLFAGKANGIVLLDPEHSWKYLFSSRGEELNCFICTADRIRELDRYGVPRLHYCEHTLRPTLLRLLNLKGGA